MLTLTAAQTAEVRRRRALHVPAVSPVSDRFPCLVTGCQGAIEVAGLCCASCWARLPGGAQFVLQRIRSTSPTQRERHLSIVETALARLSSELAGPLSDADQVEADRLNATYHGAFDSFAELLDAPGSYYPKLYQNDRAELTATERWELSRLADLYDRAQAARGDSRRAVRLGHSGL